MANAKKLIGMEADVKERLAAMKAREKKHEQVVVDFKARASRVDEKERRLGAWKSELEGLAASLDRRAEKVERMEGNVESRTAQVEENIKGVALTKTEADKVKRELVGRESDYKMEIKSLKAEIEELLGELARSRKKLNRQSIQLMPAGE
ncbi:hypothetical protein LCGC14_2269540 [marine sediment metagenome]|uniref:Uncharacterized protein n=1 Tax=marine sediment metagenome TaxID=412755 RepID=A0A0F9F9T9_9ZZZZ